MTRRLLLVIALLCAISPCLVALSGCSVPPANATVLVQPGAPDSTATQVQPEGAFVGAINGFGVDLLRSVATNKTENAIISPVSVHAALSMTANGATDETAKQMRSVLRTGDIPVDEANAQWASLLKQLGDRGPEQTLEIANAMWGNKGVDFKKPFIDVDRTSFGAQLAVLDFNRDDVAGAINKWADVNTHGMIKKVVTDVPPEAILYLANAVYFKGDWNEPFEASSTWATPFVRGDGTKVDVRMMNSSQHLPYFESVTLQATRLLYKGNDTAYYIFLPREGVGVDTALASLGGSGFAQVRRSMSEAATEVVVGLPKLDAKMGVGLKNPLSAMGMSRAFDSDRAQFSGMADSQNTIYVDQVLHRTAIKVDEKGTEAAAVTIVEMSAGSASIAQPVRIFCDRPYLFAIVDEVSGSMLFLGVVNDPTR